MRDSDRYDSQGGDGRRNSRYGQANQSQSDDGNGRRQSQHGGYSGGEYGDTREGRRQANSRSQAQSYDRPSTRTRDNQGGGNGRSDWSDEFDGSPTDRGWSQRRYDEEETSSGSFEDRGGDRTSRGFYGSSSYQHPDDRQGRGQYERGQWSGGRTGQHTGGQGYRGQRSDQGYGSTRSDQMGRFDDTNSYEERSGRGGVGRTYGSGDVDRFGSSGPGDWRDEYRDDRDSNWQNHYSRARGGYTGASTGYGRTTEYEGETGATSRGHDYDYQGAASSRGYRENRGYQQDRFSSSDSESEPDDRMGSQNDWDDDRRGEGRVGNSRSSRQTGRSNY